jgi:acyl-CoA reductase-like NAD-dependent aldehyde dehydrogenase
MLVNLQDEVDGLGQLINGELVTGSATLPVTNPATGEVVARCSAATVGMVDDAVAAAKAAFPAWSTTPEDERRRVIGAMGAAVGEAYPLIAELAAAEKGHPDAGLEALAAVWFGQHMSEQHLPVDVIEDTDDRRVTVVRAPVGVVAAIVPWNAPVLIMAEKIYSALLTGNTIVAKASPFTPLATLHVARVWKDLVPPGVVNIIVGEDEVGAAMVAHPDTRLISFTGSIEAGRAIAAAAAPRLKNLHLELGGNDAAIVLGDVDVEKVAPAVFASAFTGNGQVCAAVKRVFVHESIHDRFVEELAKVAWEKGPSLPPLSTKPQYERILELVADTLENGGKAVTGGEKPADSPGWFYPPTIVTNVRPGMRIVDEEQFGPVLPVIPFSDVDWAVEQANATEYGLCGSVWTADPALGDRLVQRLECGTAWVNHHTDIGPNIPFGGVKSSGIGRSCGQVGIDAFAELKTVVTYKDPARV